MSACRIQQIPNALFLARLATGNRALSRFAAHLAHCRGSPHTPAHCRGSPHTPAHRRGSPHTPAHCRGSLREPNPAFRVLSSGSDRGVISDLDQRIRVQLIRPAYSIQLSQDTSRIPFFPFDSLPFRAHFPNAGNSPYFFAGFGRPRRRSAALMQASDRFHFGEQKMISYPQFGEWSPMIAETQPQFQPDPSRDVRERVLIVDDDETHLEILRHGLEHQGFDVIAATRGCDLFKYIVEQKPDVVILDINLPDANGLVICQELGDAPKTSNIPVIILSGSTEKTVVRQARQAGCRFFLSKPFDPNAILLVVRQAIDESKEF